MSAVGDPERTSASLKDLHQVADMNEIAHAAAGVG